MFFTNDNNEDEIDKITAYSDYKYLVYARVSSDKDSQKDSLENQIDICRYWLEQNGFEWNNASILKDEDKSGTLFLERTALQLILEKARNREIEMVVFKSIHRLARDLKDALEIKEVLVAHGVRVVTIEEDYDSYKEGKNDMKFEMHSLFASQYPKTLSVSVSSALASKVRKGHHIGRIPYGYNRVNHKLEINEKEAKVVRQIFKWYNNDGYGFKKITHLLNDLLKEGKIGRPRNGGHWQLTTIQSIIKNPTFAGTFILNRYTQVKIDGKQKRIENPKEKWQIFVDQHPAIVSKEEWRKANNKEVVNKKRKITPWNELRELMICGRCGSNMIIMQSWKRKKDGSKTRWRYAKCSAYRRAGSAGCVNHVPITYEELRGFIIQQLLKKGETVDMNFNQGVFNRKKRERENLKKALIDLKDKHESLLDIYLDEIIDKFEFTKKRQELDEMINYYENNLIKLESTTDKSVSIKTIEEAFKRLKNINEDLRSVFLELIDEVIIHPDGEIDISYKFDG